MRSLSVGLLMLAAGTAAADCAPDRLTMRGNFGEAVFSVTVADDPEARAKGLMHVDQMPKMAGMLFVYDAPQHARFWMRNTLIPLDMIFADDAGRVQKIHPMARPLDETVIDGGDGIRYVLELNGGMSARLGLAAGDVLQHPALDQALSVAPCE